jgi:MATE family multidrug resistance protein
MGWNQWWRKEAGPREILALALPLILSNSFLTVLLIIDRVLLSRASSDAVAAAMPAAMLYYTPLMLLQNTANYAATFVAQYGGAGRPHRIGPVVWQSLYFSIAAGLAFLLMYLVAPTLVALGGHSPTIQALEITYFRCLCFAALPALVVQSLNSFFAGRGDSWTVLINDGVGMAVNVVLAYCLIFGRGGFPAMGIAGAGTATALGALTSALVALFLFLRPRYRKEFQTLTGWRFDPALFIRLLRFGIPNGLQWMLDCLAFTVFLFILGRLGDVELAASNIAFTINMVAVLPMLGMGQAVAILVGKRLGQDRPDVAEQTTWTSFGMSWAYMCCVALLYALVPGMFVYLFHGERDEKAELVAALVPVLLRYVAVYSLFDSMNLIFSFALRGAGDTRFVTMVSLLLAWPMMVIPTWIAWRQHWGIYWAWTFASAYIMSLGFTFLGRFRVGKWKTMRVIEAAPVVESHPDEVAIVGAPLS